MSPKVKNKESVEGVFKKIEEPAKTKSAEKVVRQMMHHSVFAEWITLFSDIKSFATILRDRVEFGKNEIKVMILP